MSRPNSVTNSHNSQVGGKFEKYMYMIVRVATCNFSNLNFTYNLIQTRMTPMTTSIGPMRFAELYRVAQKTGPQYLIANILKIP